MNKSDIIEWQKDQLAKFEQALSARLAMQKSWAGGTDKSWREAGCKLTKAQRRAQSEGHGRIAVKNRLDVEMCKASLAELSK